MHVCVRVCARMCVRAGHERVCVCQCVIVRVTLNLSVCSCARGCVRASAGVRGCAEASMRICGVHACLRECLCAHFCGCVGVYVRVRARARVCPCVLSRARTSVFCVPSATIFACVCGCVRVCRTTVCVRLGGCVGAAVARRRPAVLMARPAAPGGCARVVAVRCDRRSMCTFGGR